MTTPATRDNEPPTDDEIAAAIETLLATRGPGKSICPSDAARRLAANRASDDWRAWMPAIRHVAAALREDGRLRVTQGAREVDPLTTRGPIRLRLPG